MLWLAFRMLFQERGRLIITLVGIVFSSVLTLVEVGIYLGMMGNATSVVRHTDADIWVVSQNVPNFDFTQPFPLIASIACARSMRCCGPKRSTYGSRS